MPGSAHSRESDHARSAKSRALAATGLVAGVATGAFGVAAVTAAEAQASTIYACYKKSNHQLSYSKSGHCKHGSKLIWWNSKGPQGATGAAGAQGAAGPQGATGSQGATGPNGAVAGWNVYSYDLKAIGHSAFTTVASVAPTSPSGSYAANAMVELKIPASDSGSCFMSPVNASGRQVGSSTSTRDEFDRGFTTAARTENLAGNGIMFIPAGGRIDYVCQTRGTNTSSGSTDGYGLTAVRLTTGHHELLARKGARPSNQFSRRRK